MGFECSRLHVARPKISNGCLQAISGCRSIGQLGLITAGIRHDKRTACAHFSKQAAHAARDQDPLLYCLTACGDQTSVGEPDGAWTLDCVQDFNLFACYCLLC